MFNLLFLSFLASANTDDGGNAAIGEWIMFAVIVPFAIIDY